MAVLMGEILTNKNGIVFVIFIILIVVVAKNEMVVLAMLMVVSMVNKWKE